MYEWVYWLESEDGCVRSLLTLSKHLFHIVIFLLHSIYSKVFYFLHSGEPQKMLVIFYSVPQIPQILGVIAKEITNI